ncbi:hypothetical protein AYR59_04490 [Fructilactobacillus lindneri]|uniref:Tyr recombinase domain-containing protein n=1 Tax=Fructilactobacillus lindneri TaxID=53444 RepID=A0AB33BCX8_9LACO|nr:site-specific integrase [Fructilactobacillus lindneri]ANZ59311.1 hypothetical protein AYR59_04490 [Fructilactobacillus lindneri]
MKLKYSKKHPRVFSYKLKSGTLWGYRITYYDSFHKRRESQKRGFKTEMDAYRASLKEESQIAENETDLVKNKNITVKQFATAYIKSHEKLLKSSTIRSYHTAFNQHIFKLIGNEKLTSLNKTTYMSKLINPMVEQGYLRNTILNVHHRMMTIMNEAVDDGILKRNKLSHVKISDTGKQEKRIMTKKELKQFNARLEKEPILTQVIMYTLQQTGMRQGELCGLQWQDIDLDNLKINIKRTRDDIGVRTPKTQQSIREITISQSLSNLLKQYKVETSKAFLKHGKPFEKSTYVLQSEYLNPLVNTGISLRLRNTLKRAKLGYLVGHFTAHTFRHMYASYLLNSGVPLSEVSAALGHSNPQMTLSIYTERNPEKNDNLADKFNELW